MKEIKFRVYQKDTKTYLNSGHDIAILSLPANWRDYVILEQYTGLKDKKRNNAEVFQGDIYKWCGLTFPITIDDFHGYRFMFGKDQLCRAVIENGIYKGNIHENPELLKN